MKHGLSPQYLSSLLPETVGQTSADNLRNASDSITVQCKTHLFANSFLHLTIRDWNQLSDEQRNAPSLKSFKTKLYSDTVKTPYFISLASESLTFYTVD